METEQEHEVNRLYKECVIRHNENPYSTAIAISEAIGGITRIDYDSNRLRVYNHTMNIGISPRGLKEKQRQRLEELVVLMHSIAEESREGFDRTQVSVIRLEPRGGRPISTKHYMQDFLRYQQQVMIKYAA